jgi:hypothetical protein
MSAVLITGMSGAGKSTIAQVLARRGLASLDADGDPLLARSVDCDGNVAEDPSDPDFAWLARHSWAWDPARLDVLIRTAAPATLYVCGGAANELELADRFTQMFLLEMDGYDGSDWPHHDGLKWPHPLVAVGTGMVVSA